MPDKTVTITTTKRCDKSKTFAHESNERMETPFIILAPECFESIESTNTMSVHLFGY